MWGSLSSEVYGYGAEVALLVAHRNRKICVFEKEIEWCIDIVYSLHHGQRDKKTY